MKNTLNNNDPSSLSQIEEMDFLVIMEFKEDISKYTANNEIGNILAEISKLHLSLNPPASFKEMTRIRLAISDVFSKPIAMSHMVRYAFTMQGDRTHLDQVLGALKTLSGRTSKICMLDGVVLNPSLSMAGERDEVLTAYSNLNAVLEPLNLSPTVSASQLGNIEHHESMSSRP